MSIRSDQMELLARVSSVLAKRHDVIATNIANVNTPNFRAKEVLFEEEFQKHLRDGNVDLAGDVDAHLVDDETTPVRADGNNVLVEKEMGQMYRNSMVASVFGQLLKSKIEQMRMAINGR